MWDKLYNMIDWNLMEKGSDASAIAGSSEPFLFL